MVRKAVAALGVIGLSACGGATTTYSPNTYPALTGTNLVTKSPFTAGLSSQTTTSGGTATDMVDHSLNVKVAFVTPKQAKITITPPGSGSVPVTYTLNDPGTGIFSSGGASPVTMVYSASDTGSGAAKNMLTFVVNDASGAGFTDRFIGGTPTLAADRPTSGTAAYNGKMVAQDGTGAITTASVVINADFGGATITNATINNFSSAALAGVTFQLLNTPISNGTFQGNLAVSGTTSTGTNFLSGAFYGPAAAEAGGTVRINTTAQSLAGVFGTKR